LRATPVEFLTDDEAAAYGRFAGPPAQADLERVFFLDDEDRALVGQRRGEHMGLGFALQWKDFTDVDGEFAAWVAARSWTSGDGPKAIFTDRVGWLRERKVLLPGDCAQPARRSRRAAGRARPNLDAAYTEVGGRLIANPDVRVDASGRST
jgi:Domain of unknown function (DUF4158)